MAKTFDNIADASAINYQMLVSLTTMTMDGLLPASPPLNLLTMPYDTFVLISQSCKGTVTTATAPEHSGSRFVPARKGLGTMKLQTGEQAARAMFQVAEAPELTRLRACHACQSRLKPWLLKSLPLPRSDPREVASHRRSYATWRR